MAENLLRVSQGGLRFLSDKVLSDVWSQVLPRRVEVFSHASNRPLAVAAGEAHTCVYMSDGSVVTFGRLTHGRYAQGCIILPVEALTQAMAHQTWDDWSHFSY